MGKNSQRNKKKAQRTIKKHNKSKSRNVEKELIEEPREELQEELIEYHPAKQDIQHIQNIIFEIAVREAGASSIFTISDILSNLEEIKRRCPEFRPTKKQQDTGLIHYHIQILLNQNKIVARRKAKNIYVIVNYSDHKLKPKFEQVVISREVKIISALDFEFELAPECEIYASLKNIELI